MLPLPVYHELDLHIASKFLAPITSSMLHIIVGGCSLNLVLPSTYC